MWATSYNTWMRWSLTPEISRHLELSSFNVTLKKREKLEVRRHLRRIVSEVQIHPWSSVSWKPKFDFSHSACKLKTLPEMFGGERSLKLPQTTPERKRKCHILSELFCRHAKWLVLWCKEFQSSFSKPDIKSMLWESLLVVAPVCTMACNEKLDSKTGLDQERPPLCNQYGESTCSWERQTNWTVFILQWLYWQHEYSLRPRPTA